LAEWLDRICPRMPYSGGSARIELGGEVILYHPDHEGKRGIVRGLDTSEEGSRYYIDVDGALVGALPDELEPVRRQSQRRT